MREPWKGDRAFWGSFVFMAPKQASRNWLTFANVLTLSRLAAAPFLFVAIWGGSSGLALFFFVFGAVSDLVDGAVARRRGEVSRLGGLLDHATDATFVSAGLLALALRSEITVWLPIGVAAAFIQYVLDSRIHENRALRASRLGRWNGIAYFAFLGLVVVRDGMGFPGTGTLAVAAGAWFLLALTLVSMLDRALASARTRPS